MLDGSLIDYNMYVYVSQHTLTLQVTKKNPLAYCSNKNHNFANIGHKNMNDASF